jgi:hypothetical protein
MLNDSEFRVICGIEEGSREKETARSGGAHEGEEEAEAEEREV